MNFINKTASALAPFAVVLGIAAPPRDADQKKWLYFHSLCFLSLLSMWRVVRLS